MTLMYLLMEPAGDIVKYDCMREIVDDTCQQATFQVVQCDSHATKWHIYVLAVQGAIFAVAAAVVVVVAVVAGGSLLLLEGLTFSAILLQIDCVKLT